MLDMAITEAFGIGNVARVTPLSTGLINNSYAIDCENGQSVLLQQINTSIFLTPENIQANYLLIYNHFNKMGSYRLPRLLHTVDHQDLFYHQRQAWRCLEFFRDTYSPLTAQSPQEAYTVAACFGKFSADLSSIDVKRFHYILPGFHDLNMRFRQFEEALYNTSKLRKKDAEALIQLAYDNKGYVQWYKDMLRQPERYPLHILHQDCKIANILFNKKDASLRCPIDLDTTQPGHFFSDIGDMIRSMVPNISENEIQLEKMELRTDYYQAIRNGYLQEMEAYLTEAERNDIDISGNIIIYMQALRFLSDYLNGDIYYKISYETQNKNRAANQFKLLQLLQEYQKVGTLI